MASNAGTRTVNKSRRSIDSTEPSHGASPGRDHANHIDFKVVCSIGPALAYHVGCMVGDALYVHGGINKSGSTSPLNELHRFDFSAGSWRQLRSAECPHLSHHAAVIIGDRYLVFIGGWTGKIRTADIAVYDTTSNQWSHHTTSGFPVGAGLSSHTASLLGSGRILVIGREGSLRTQRRSGSAFILSGDPSRSGSVFTYSEFHASVSSRALHTASVIRSNAYVIGGRDTDVLEILRLPEPAPASSNCLALSRLAEHADKNGVRMKTVGTNSMKSRKGHVAVAGSDFLVIHGGWTFDGKSRDPVGDMFVLSLNPAPHWISVGRSSVELAGHVCFVRGDDVYLHGGEGSRGTVHGFLHRLEFL